MWVTGASSWETGSLSGTSGVRVRTFVIVFRTPGLSIDYSFVIKEPGAPTTTICAAGTCINGWIDIPVSMYPDGADI